MSEFYVGFSFHNDQGPIDQVDAPHVNVFTVLAVGLYLRDKTRPIPAWGTVNICRCLADAIGNDA